MVPCAGSLARQYPHVFRITSISMAKSSSFNQQTRIPACPVQINGLRTCSSCKVSSFALNSGAFVLFGVSVLGNLGVENSRLLAVSDGGGGGGGGYSGSDNGNFGGGGGDAAGGSSGNNWTLLSWYLSLLEKYPVITKAVTSALLTLALMYLYLSQLVTVSGASGAFIRLIHDQFVFSPIFIGFFLSTLVMLEGRPSEVVPKLQQIILPVWA